MKPTIPLEGGRNSSIPPSIGPRYFTRISNITRQRFTAKIPVTLGLLLLALPCAGNPPEILRITKKNQLIWTNSQPGLFAQIDRSVDLKIWQPYYYNLATDGLVTNLLPDAEQSPAFYRVAIVTHIPDPSLVLQLPFDNDFAEGMVIDASGHNNHGMRYNATNWPSYCAGPDVTRAGKFHRYSQGSGDYVAVIGSPDLDNLTNGTLLVWADYTTNSYGWTALVDAGWWQHDNSWVLGRSYSSDTRFAVYSGGLEYDVVRFPDAAPNYANGGWHYYGVTWDGTNFVGYLDGKPVSSSSQARFPALVLGGYYRWIAIGCRSGNQSPDWASTSHPTSGWMDGGLDDLRIYNRALSSDEIAALFRSFDRTAPTAPANLLARTDASTQVELRWDLSSDNSAVVGYTVLRDGVLRGPANGRLFVDTGLSPNHTYHYTVLAYDNGGNCSPPLAEVTVATPATGTPVDVLLDEADGEPWVTQAGGWSVRTNAGANFTYYVQDDNTLKGLKKVTFQPMLPSAGNYSLYIWYPYRANGAANVPVEIVANGTTNTVHVNQLQNGSKWNLIATQSLPAGTNTLVRVSNSGTTGYVEADAIRLVKQ